MNSNKPISMTYTINFHKGFLVLESLIAAAEYTKQNTQQFYISPEDELNFMEAVLKRVRGMSFMIMMMRRGEYVFNLNGKRWTVSVDLKLPQGQASIGEMTLLCFSGVSAFYQPLFYGDPTELTNVSEVFDIGKCKHCEADYLICVETAGRKDCCREHLSKNI